jgi:hypothetical protein
MKQNSEVGTGSHLSDTFLAVRNKEMLIVALEGPREPGGTEIGWLYQLPAECKECERHRRKANCRL